MVTLQKHYNYYTCCTVPGTLQSSKYIILYNISSPFLSMIYNAGQNAYLNRILLSLQTAMFSIKWMIIQRYIHTTKVHLKCTLYSDPETKPVIFLDDCQAKPSLILTVFQVLYCTLLYRTEVSHWTGMCEWNDGRRHWAPRLGSGPYWLTVQSVMIPTTCQSKVCRKESS